MIYLNPYPVPKHSSCYEVGYEGGLNHQTMNTKLIILLPFFAIVCFAHCADPSETSTEVSEERLINADANPAEWLTNGRNYKEDRHSPLDQINISNIDSLGLAWSIDLGTKRGLEATPILANGIMYFSGTWSTVYAVDVRKGEIIWTFDPEVPKEYGEKVCCDVVNRGVAVYQDKVYVGSLDGRLIALDAHTGEKAWEVLTIDPTKPYSITGAPRVIKGKVIIGNGGADYGVRGYVTAYDAVTGEEAWRFYTVPGNPDEPFESAAMEAAAKTWNGNWWEYGGGGTAWDAMAFDPELNLLYIGTGNGSPWNRDIRSPSGGDNLYLSSIVALNPDNGKLVWYYQTTPGESWDYTATQPIILADLEIDGQQVKALMQAPKNGFFYVLDRTNGAFISGTPYVYTNWAKSIDEETGRPVETNHARYPAMNVQISPGPAGGHNWQAMAYNANTGLVYIPAREDGYPYGQPKDWAFKDDGRSWNQGSEYDPERTTRPDSMTQRNFGKLIAWNPVTNQEEWSVWQKSSWNAGVLTTDDLVFQGNAEGQLCAYDATTGERVWSYDLETGIVAPPITYEIDGRQYVSILAGWGGVIGLWNTFTKQLNPGGLYTFALGGNESLPDFPEVAAKSLVDIAFQATPAQISNGGKLFGRYCRFCHGGGVIPDLAYSRPETFEAFHEIVGKGTLLGLGMPDFGDRLTADNIEDIKYYILADAKAKRESLSK